MIHKTIAIIGANESIAMLIMKVKEMGHSTVVFSKSKNEPGASIADYFFEISIEDKEKILNICRKLKVNAVTSITSDLAVNTVNYVARNMGLICNSEKTDILARNKYQMRCAFKNAGIYTPPQFLLVSSVDELPTLSIKYPIIVKPTDRWSSKGVTRVNSYSELTGATTNAINLSLNHTAIIESFIEGEEYSAECICYNGNTQILAYTKKETTGAPHYVEKGHMQPAPLTLNQKKLIEKTIKSAISSLDIKNSAAHVEFKIMPDGTIGIIEIGARMGGDFIGTDLTPISTGYDYIKMVIEVSCGVPPNMERKINPVTTPVYVKFILDKDDYEEFKVIKNNTTKRIIRYKLFDEDFSSVVLDSSTRHGYYIYT